MTLEQIDVEKDILNRKVASSNVILCRIVQVKVTCIYLHYQYWKSFFFLVGQAVPLITNFCNVKTPSSLQIRRKEEKGKVLSLVLMCYSRLG
jgi:Mg2+/citrate symporter